MFEEFRNLIQREVARYVRKKAFPRIGLVDSYNPSIHAAKVLFQDENKLSGWLPIGTNAAGNGWGLAFAPAIGAQVVVNFHDGDHDLGFISHQLFSVVDQPPSVPSGDLWLVHQNGQAVKLQASGTLAVVGTNIEIGASGGSYLNVVTAAMVEFFNNHTHSDGGAGTPVQTMGTTELTTNFMAT